MKTTLAFLSCMLFASAAFAQNPAPTPTPANQNPFLQGKKNTTEDLRKGITKFPYTFLVGGWTMHIHFDAKGTGAEEDWSFKWHARDGQTIELTSDKFKGMKAVLTFSDDYTTYTGFHFDGTKEVKGAQIIPH